MTPAQKIDRARAALILDHPFFGALVCRLRPVADASIKTASTNGVVVRYNPQWIDALPEPEIRGVFAHEVLHCAAGHIWRRDDRDGRRWNVACDFEINPQLRAAGLSLPADALGDDYKGQAAEAIYDRLPEPQQGGTDDKPGNDPGGCGGVDDAPADAGNDPAQGQGQTATGAGNLHEQWQVATVQAAKAAQMMGTLPDCAKRLLDDLTRPSLDWRTILADFVCRSARNDYDWSRPNGRYLSRGIILPGLRSNELPAVVVAIDTSGSIDDQTLSAFTSAVSDVLAAYPTTAHVVTCDAQVNTVAEYQTADLPIHVDCEGGGGTDFRPVFSWVSERGLTPAALIYLTDLDGSFPDHEPDYPVLWARIPGYQETAPFGEILPIPAV